MAGNEVRFVDIVGALDRLVAKTQVRNGYAAGLFGVILEISLNVFVGVVADDLDRVFVRTDRTVAAEAPEFALDGARCRGVGRGFLFERKVGDVVVDADCELTFGRFFLKMFINSEHARGRGVLGTEAVTTAANFRGSAHFVKRGNHIEEQRFADGAGLFGSVENSDFLRGLGNSFAECFCGERSVKTNFDKTDFLAFCG